LQLSFALSLLCLTGEFECVWLGLIQSVPVQVRVPSFFFPTPYFLAEIPYSSSFFLCSAVFSYRTGTHFFVSFLLLNRTVADDLLSKSTFSLPNNLSVPAPYPPSFLLLLLFSFPVGVSKTELFHLSSHLCLEAGLGSSYILTSWLAKTLDWKVLLFLTLLPSR